MEEKTSRFKKNWGRFYNGVKLVEIGVDFLCSEVGSRIAAEAVNKLMPGAGFATVLGAKVIGRGIGALGAHEAQKDLNAALDAFDKVIENDFVDDEITDEPSEVETEVVTE